MSPFPPPPFLRKGVTDVRGHGPLRLVDLLPPCGPRESVAPRNVRSEARQQFGFTVQLRRHNRYAEFPAEAA
jgi:hypothetical protein